MPLGGWELAIVLVIVLVLFGPKRLPGLGKSLGTGMREFKESITGNSRDEDDEEDRPELKQATADGDPERPVPPAENRETAPAATPRPADDAG